MIVDAYLEQYEFTCRSCGYEWRNTYGVRHIEDEEGAGWGYYDVSGTPAAPPAGGVRCPSCASVAVTHRLLDRRRAEAGGEERASVPEEGEEQPLSAAASSAAHEAVAKTALPSPKVVVGLDGSPAARAALRWAAAEAARSGAELEVVVAWELDVGFAFGVSRDLDERGARQKAEDCVAEVLGSPVPVPISITLSRGAAGPMLVEAAGAGDLLVVGSHGHSPVVDLLLGSVSEHCVRHARCPVVIVHASGAPAPSEHR